MKKLWIYLLILCLCTACNLHHDENNASYNIGRVQISETNCIGSKTPIEKDPILIKFNLDQENSEVKNINLQKVEFNLNPTSDCINSLKESMDNDYRYFYGLNKLSNEEDIVNYFLVGNEKFFLKKDGVSYIDLNQDGNSDFLDMCYSSEGLHFNIWDSKSKNIRLFHDYISLGFDTIDNCDEKDYLEP